VSRYEPRTALEVALTGLAPIAALLPRSPALPRAGAYSWRSGQGRLSPVERIFRKRFERRGNVFRSRCFPLPGCDRKSVKDCGQKRMANGARSG